jgi:ABC-type polysaccharide/polyol phosphate export permease
MYTIIQDILIKRDLIRELVIKDLRIRYSRPILGFFWVFLSPLLIVAVFYIIFSIILRVKIEEAPFILYLMSAIFPWRFFQDSLMCSATSLIDNKNLIRECNFPHYFIPLSIVFSNSIIFLPSLAILIITALIYLKGLPIFIVLLPIVLAVHLIVTFSIALVASILYVKWRDTRYILEATLQALFYSTPVFYSVYFVKNSFPGPWFKLYIHNPFVGILNLYRLAIIKDFCFKIKEGIGLFSLMFVPAVFAIALFLLSFHFYKKNKNTINDYLSY